MPYITKEQLDAIERRNKIDPIKNVFIWAIIGIVGGYGLFRLVVYFVQ